MKTDKPLNLTGSLTSYLEKAKEVCHYLVEDWDEIVPFLKETSLLEEFSKAIQQSEETYDKHRIAKISRSAKLKDRKANIDALYTLYAEVREGLIFAADSAAKKQEIRQQFSYKPTLNNLVLDLNGFKSILRKMEPLPQFLPQNYEETFEALFAVYREYLGTPTDQRIHQKSLREKRDDAFREMLALQKLVKETGRFAFRNNPEMKKRYR